MNIWQKITLNLNLFAHVHLKFCFLICFTCYIHIVSDLYIPPAIILHFLQIFQIVTEGILTRMSYTKLIYIIIHIGEQFHAAWHLSLQKFFHPKILFLYPFPYGLIPFCHLLKQINQPKIKIYHIVIQKFKLL